MGVSFNVNSFEELIQNHGYNIKWSQAILCHCFDKEQPDIHCPYCKGSGYRYLPSKSIKAISTTFGGNAELNIQGLRELGTAYITPSVDIIMGYRDRIEFVDIECKYSQVIEMGIDKTSSTYRNIRKVLFVTLENILYEEGIDFEISKDRHHLVWINSENKPVKGTILSILYLTTPTYLVQDMAHELRSTRISKGTRAPYTEELPKQYYIKREGFIYGHTVNEKLESVKEELSYE